MACISLRRVDMILWDLVWQGLEQDTSAVRGHSRKIIQVQHRTTDMLLHARAKAQEITRGRLIIVVDPPTQCCLMEVEELLLSLFGEGEMQ